MDHAAALDSLIARMVADYVAHNRAAGILTAMLNDAGVGLFPVIDHLTIRTFDIDRGAEPFVALGYTYDETIEYDDWYAKVYRKAGYPALTTSAGKPVSSPAGSRNSETRTFTMWQCESKTSRKQWSGSNKRVWYFPGILSESAATTSGKSFPPLKWWMASRSQSWNWRNGIAAISASCRRKPTAS